MSEKKQFANLAVAGLAVVPAFLGATSAADSSTTSQRPPAAVAEYNPSAQEDKSPAESGVPSSTVPPTIPSEAVQNRPAPIKDESIDIGTISAAPPVTKQEQTIGLPIVRNINLGLERDNNGTLNTGDDGPEPGLPLDELIPDVMPNIVLGSSNGNGGTIGDGWHVDSRRDAQQRVVPQIKYVEGETIETQTRVTDIKKYPIQTPWEVDFQTSPELATELNSAMEDCYAQIEARQRQGYTLTKVEVGGLASGEDNVTKPGDPMANLGEPSKPNQNLANQRGIAGVSTMTEVLESHGISADVLEFIQGQEIEPNPKEIDQILQYASMLGQNPLELLQDYNRARAEGLQPLMDELFVGNRGVVCISSFTKLETTLLPGHTELKVVLVPIVEHGQKRIWRIEVPGEVLLLPLIYIALRSVGLPGVSKRRGGSKKSSPLFPERNPENSQTYDPPFPIRKPKTPPLPELKPAQQPPYRPALPPKEIGKSQEGYHTKPQSNKQPNVHTNFHNSGVAGHRGNSQHQKSRPNKSVGSGKGRRNGSR